MEGEKKKENRIMCKNMKINFFNKGYILLIKYYISF